MRLLLLLSFALLILIASSSSSSLVCANDKAHEAAEIEKQIDGKHPIIRPVVDAKHGRVNRTFLENEDEIAKFRSRLPAYILKRQHPSTRIIAIGDLHGDIDAAKEIFRIAQVTNDEGHWNTGTDTVVQVGDVLDRGPHGFLIMDFLQRLKQEAKAHGGELIQLCGNHELMNYFGDFRFVHPKLIEAAGGIKKYAALVQQGGKYGKIIANLPAAVIRNGTVFVHAGMTEVNIRQFGGIDDMNAIFRRVMNDVDRGHAIVGEHGPIWTRQNIYGALAQKQCFTTEHALASLSALEIEEREAVTSPLKFTEAHSPFYRSKVHRMVVGHTIMTDGEPRTFCSGSLFAIDVEMSAYMVGGGYLAYYEQLKQGVEGIQPITLFTLPRGTWVQHPALWFPKANTTNFEDRDVVGTDPEEDGGEGHDLEQHHVEHHGNGVQLVAVRDKKRFGGFNSGRHGGGGLFRGTFLMPVIGVVAVLAVALLYAVIKKAQLMNRGHNVNNVAGNNNKHAV
jgi:hypothetical protein